ncbi:hypothetical protein AWC32_19785 [Mycobacterium xenopi]|nr:hypothetical protein AWC32_19785 [Mycobacterium xenopi]
MLAGPLVPIAEEVARPLSRSTEAVAAIGAIEVQLWGTDNGPILAAWPMSAAALPRPLSLNPWMVPVI